MEAHQRLLNVHHAVLGKVAVVCSDFGSVSEAPMCMKALAARDARHIPRNDGLFFLGWLNLNTNQNLNVVGCALGWA